MTKHFSYVLSALLATALLVSFIPAASADIREPGQSWADYWTSTPSLKEAWKGYFLLGNVFGGPVDMNDETRRTMLLHNFNVLTAENNMKPAHLSTGGAGSDPVENGGNGTYRWTFRAADEMMVFAEENDLLIFGHVLLWHNQTPAWINGGGGQDEGIYTRARARANMEHFIKTVVTHFDQWELADGSKRVFAWDVVNEAFSDGVNWSPDALPGQWRNHMRQPTQSGWIRAYANGMAEGEHPSDFIYDAFRFSRRYTDAILYYNDFNLYFDGKASAVAQMIQELNAQWATDKENNPEAVDNANEYTGRLLIEGIGMQSHNYIWDTPASAVERNIQRFIDAGVEISISELDLFVFAPWNGEPQGIRGQYVDLRDRTAEQLVANTNNQRQRYYWRDRGITTGAEVEVEQAIRYAEYFQVYRKFTDHIRRVTFWGLRDNDSWRRNHNPLLWNSDYSPKEAFWGVIDPDGYLGCIRRHTKTREFYIFFRKPHAISHAVLPRPPAQCVFPPH